MRPDVDRASGRCGAGGEPGRHRLRVAFTQHRAEQRRADPATAGRRGHHELGRRRAGDGEVHLRVAEQQVAGRRAVRRRGIRARLAHEQVRDKRPRVGQPEQRLLGERGDAVVPGRVVRERADRLDGRRGSGPRRRRGVGML
ncbi:hypothetical protein LJB74_12520 [Cellulomonas sp. P24]|nr:hypothetical protein [Cellulomonas sp. P24]MCR6493255.1 hypothetical protein [Cellulomonas sp. P24]